MHFNAIAGSSSWPRWPLSRRRGARFVRVPGGFVIGAGFALKSLGVAYEQALVMIMFNFVIAILLMVGVGPVVLWRDGVAIRSLALAGETDETA